MSPFAQYSSLGLAVALSSLAFGCTYGDDSGTYDAGACGGALQRESIDADELLEVDFGEGAGIQIEYQTGGRWHVFTSCDTLVSGYDCYFDMLLRPADGGEILGIFGEDLETSDAVLLVGQSFAQLAVFTDEASDGLWLDLEPGEALNVDALLDGGCAGDVVSWISAQTVQTGVSSNPFELEPASP